MKFSQHAMDLEDLMQVALREIKRKKGAWYKYYQTPLRNRSTFRCNKAQYLAKNTFNHEEDHDW